MKQPTLSQLILIAASKLPPIFSENLLVEAAWKLDKKRFGLKGYEQDYPDNNIVKSVLMGKKGLIATNQLKKIKCKKGEGTKYAVPSEAQ